MEGVGEGRAFIQIGDTYGQLAVAEGAITCANCRCDFVFYWNDTRQRIEGSPTSIDPNECTCECHTEDYGREWTATLSFKRNWDSEAIQTRIT